VYPWFEGGNGKLDSFSERVVAVFTFFTNCRSLPVPFFRLSFLSSLDWLTGHIACARVCAIDPHVVMVPRRR